jgi:hypothetical protein
MTTPSKRAFLRGAAAVAAAAIPAAGALASAHNPDAALLALQAELDDADTVREALYREWTAAEEACSVLKPDKPQEPCTPKAIVDAFQAGDSRPLIAYHEASKSSDTDYEEALKAWREATEKAERDSGFEEAEEAVSAAEDVRLAIRDKIIAIRARTLAGLTFKARYAASHFPGDPDAEIMISIVEDLLSLAGET